MRRIRFKVLGFASFVMAFFLSLFTPGSWVNRAIATTMCGVIGACSPGAIANLMKGGDRAFAADVRVLVADRSSEFDDAIEAGQRAGKEAGTNAAKEIEGRSSDFTDTPNPNQTRPNQEIQADWNTSGTTPKVTFSSNNAASELQKILDDLQAAGGPGSALEGIPEQMCSMAQTMVDTYNAGAHATGVGITAESSPEELRGELGNTASDIKMLSEGMNRLMSGLNTSEFNMNLIKSLAWSEIKKRIVPGVDFKLNCDKYAPSVEENYNPCTMCSYQVLLRKMGGNGKEVSSEVTLFGRCEDMDSPGKLLAIMRPQVAKIDREDARIERERNLSRSSRRRIIGLPTRVTDSSTQGKNCGYENASLAGSHAAQDIPSIKVVVGSNSIPVNQTTTATVEFVDPTCTASDVILGVPSMAMRSGHKKVPAESKCGGKFEFNVGRWISREGYQAGCIEFENIFVGEVQTAGNRLKAYSSPVIVKDPLKTSAAYGSCYAEVFETPLTGGDGTGAGGSLIRTIKKILPIRLPF
jgi:hypothetical protein